MDDFNTIRLKRKILEEFKEYSLKTSPNYSETLEFMIAFFKDTGISPYDTIRNPILASTVAIYRRLDYIVALLKDIEKTQLIPTREMLESLFKGAEEKEEKQPLFIERTREEIEASKTDAEKLIDYYSEEADKNKRELYDVKKEVRNLLSELFYIKNTFGKSYYRLDISQEKIEEIKSKYVI